MFSSTGALWPNSEAPRAVCQDRRGTTNYFSNSETVDTLTAIRAQRLASMFGLTDTRARTIADLAWGGEHG